MLRIKPVWGFGNEIPKALNLNKNKLMLLFNMRVLSVNGVGIWTHQHVWVFVDIRDSLIDLITVPLIYDDFYLKG